MRDRLEASGETLHVLLVDDSADDAELVLGELRRGGRSVTAERVCDAEAMGASLTKHPWDLVLSDWSMPSFSGRAALDLLRGSGLDVPFIIVSGTVTEELAIAAMSSGARDWVVKGKLGRLLPAVDRELKASAERRRAAESIRRGEERLRQSQKMDAIGGLAAGVAHDFNNVLSVIIGHADLLLMDIGAEHPMRESLEEIREAAGRASDLTRQLLAFSRQQILQPRATDITQVVAGMSKMLRRLIGEDVELTLVTPPRSGAVLVDPGQIEQVIMNLAVNARDAMPDGGTLTIAVSELDVAEEHDVAAGLEPGPHVVLSVSDTGVGMDAATRARIFEPFFTTKEPGRGTGLGLATVFGIVEQSGGTISTTSEPGRGTTFRVYLPRLFDAHVGAPARAEARPLALRTGEGTVLVVEDDDAVRGMVRSVLERAGYRVVVASNGREALVLCDSRRADVDLVITDVVMPQMNGREFANRLHALRPGLKVLFMSGYTDGAIVRRGVLDPGIAFIQKPVAPHVLVQKVEEMIDRR